MGAADEVLVAMVEVAADRLGAYGYVLTGSQSEAEELVQDAIVRVFARRTRFEVPAQAEAYVRRTMRTMHIDRVRREALWRRLMPGQARAEVDPDRVEQVAARDAVSQALGVLSPQKRTAVVLRYFDDLSYAQIAESMRVSVGTVKRYLSEALSTMGEQFDPSDEDAALVERRRP